MKLKSFFADTVEEAIRQARQEMGPDAMLVNSKRSGAEARHLGAFEVVVCADEALAAPPVEQTAAGSRSAAAPSSDRLSGEVSELRRQIERLALTLMRSSSSMAGFASSPALAQAFAALTDAELDADLAYEIISGIGAEAPAGAVRAALSKLIRVNPALGRPEAHARVALVGPPGAGKTSTLVKLAVRYGISQKRSTQILTTDTHRIAAADELQSYAAILGVGCQVIETPGALAQALEENRHKDLILIDTPGMSRAEIEAGEDLARFLAGSAEVETHLVLPASMRAADLKHVAAQYGIFQPHKLLATRLDETETCGPIVSVSIRTGIPVSFLCSGQRIPEDLEPARVDQLLDLLLRVPHREPEQSRFGAVAA
jgi:flagellar biosynthesis protein FlhF